MSTLNDMITAALNDSPSNFQSAFNDMLLDKISAAVQAKKVEIAQNYFNSEQETSQSDSSQEDEQQEDNTDENTEAAAREEG